VQREIGSFPDWELRIARSRKKSEILIGNALHIKIVIMVGARRAKFGLHGGERKQRQAGAVESSQRRRIDLRPAFPATFIPLLVPCSLNFLEFRPWKTELGVLMHSQSGLQRYLQAYCLVCNIALMNGLGYRCKGCRRATWQKKTKCLSAVLN